MRMRLIAGIVCCAAIAVAAVDGIVVSTVSTYTHSYGWHFGTIEKFVITNSIVEESIQLYSNTDARCVSIAPSGTMVAFIRSDGKICLRSMNVGATEITVLANIPADSWIDWPVEDYIYYVNEWQGDELYRVHTTTKATELVATGLASAMQFGVAQSCSVGVAVTCCYSARSWSLSGNMITLITDNGGVGVGISPDGSKFTNQQGDHATVKIRAFDGTEVGIWTTARCSDAGSYWSRLRWSSNSNDWVIFTQGAPYQLESYHNAVLYYVPDNGVTHIQVTNAASGTYYEGDDFWVGVEPTVPVIITDTSALTFSAVVNEPVTDSQVIIISNGSVGTLPALSATESAAWLSVTIEGSGNAQRAVNRVNVDGLTTGTYTTQVTLSGDGVASAGYSVTLNISPVPLLVISPNGGEVFEVGDTLQVVWSCDTAVISSVIVELSTNDGISFTTLTSGSIPSHTPGIANGEFKYFIGSSDFNSTSCIVRVKEYLGDLSDISDAPFTIQNAPSVMTSLCIAPHNISVYPLDTCRFTAVALDQYGDTLDPQPATYTWTVSGGGTISTTGLFTAEELSGGPYYVVALSGGISDTAQVTVNDAPPVATTIFVNPSYATVVPGEQEQFTAVTVDQYGDTLSNTSLTYSWSVTGGGTISASGLFTAADTAGGPSDVHATTESISGDAQVVVANPPPLLDSIAVSPESVLVRINDEQQFTAIGFDQYGDTLEEQPSFSWTISGGGSVSVTGLFVADSIAGGPYTVSATANSVSGNASVTVSDEVPVAAQIIIEPDTVLLKPGAKQQFSAQVLDQYGKQIVPQPSLTWSVPADAGTVVGGLFTAGITAGDYTITASAQGCEGQAIISVLPVLVRIVPQSGAFSHAVEVALKGETTGDSLFYSIDNGTPRHYSKNFFVLQTATVKAWHKGYESFSDSAVYTIAYPAARTIDDGTFSIRTTARQWRPVGVGYDLTDKSPLAVVSPDGAYDRDVWQLLKWSPASGGGQWTAFDGLNSSKFLFTRGAVYWIITNKSLTIPLPEGTTSPLDSLFNATIQPHDWFDFSLPFDIDSGVSFGSIAAATDAPESTYAVWQFDNGAFRLVSDPLIKAVPDSARCRPRNYYTALNMSNSAMTLVIPPVSAVSHNLLKKQAKFPGVISDCWGADVHIENKQGHALSFLYYRTGMADAEIDLPAPPSIQTITAGICLDKSRPACSYSYRGMNSRMGKMDNVKLINAGTCTEQVRLYKKLNGILPEGVTIKIWDYDTEKWICAAGEPYALSIDSKATHTVGILAGGEDDFRRFISAAARIPVVKIQRRASTVTFSVEHEMYSTLNVALYDMRGRRIIARQGIGMIQLNASRETNSPTASATFIARIDVKNINGKTVYTLKRNVILVK